MRKRLPMPFDCRKHCQISSPCKHKKADLEPSKYLLLKAIASIPISQVGDFQGKDVKVLDLGKGRYAIEM